MANLETLELTINANAESASQGLSNLINSLSLLSKRVGSAVSGLKLLNAELSKLKGFKIGNIAQSIATDKGVKNVIEQTKAFKAQASVMKEFQKMNLLKLEIIY